MMNPFSMFHPNLTMGKCSKSRGNIRGDGGIQGGGGLLKKKNANVTDMNMKQVFIKIG